MEERKIVNVVVLQKDNSRYSFIQEENECGAKYYKIVSATCLFCGETHHTEYTTKERGNEKYNRLLQKGFKKFRNVREVSWYATVENNTPYKEAWEIEGDYLIPICSRGITYTEEEPIWAD